MTKNTVKNDIKKSKRILSWDVGITNLAYSIIDFDGPVMKLLDMAVIDTVDYRKPCCFMTRNKRECGKIAQTSFTIHEHVESKMKYYCKTHVKKVDYEIVIPVSDIQCSKCKKPAVKIVNNSEYGWCTKHYEKHSGIYKRRCVKKFDQTCKNQSLTKIGKSMFEKLDKNPAFLDVDVVLIELQPVLKNPMMKSVANMLMSYFILRGLHEGKGRFKDDLNNVRTVNASGKLKVNKVTTNKQLKKGKNEKDVYNITKGLGILYSKALMTESDKKFLEKNKKKEDDMCDSYLQAIRFYYENDLPKNMIDKLKKASEKIDNDVKTGKKSKKGNKGISVILNTNGEMVLKK